MRIGISCYPTHGGSGVVATELGVKLAKLNHEVHVISYSVPFRLNKFQPNLFFHEIEILNYPLFRHPPFELALVNKMAEVIKSAKLDIVHAHYAIPHAISALLAQQIVEDPKVKVVTTLHGTDITLVGRDPSFYDITRFSIQQSEGVTAVSEFLKQKTIQLFQIERPIEVIHNFVDIKRFSRQTSSNRKYYAKENEKILCHVSNFRPVKRILDVIKVFARVQEKIPAILLLVGEGPERNRAQDLILKLGLQYKVHFLGNQENVEDILTISDLFLLPSEKESFGLVALEAMSCGVPVVGSNAEGIPEVVKHGETGFLHDVGDVEAMAESAIQILSNPDLFEKVSQNARQWVVENFDSGKHVQRYLDFYQKVLNS